MCLQYIVILYNSALCSLVVSVKNEKGTSWFLCKVQSANAHTVSLSLS